MYKYESQNLPAFLCQGKGGLLVSFLLAIQESVRISFSFVRGVELQVEGGFKREALRQRPIPTLGHKPSLLTHSEQK